MEHQFKTGDAMISKGQTYKAINCEALKLGDLGVCHKCVFFTRIGGRDNCVPCAGVVWVTEQKFILHRLTS